MSLNIENLFEAINQPVIQLSSRWNIFRQLFDSGDENIELLNSSGSIVFGLLQKLLIDDAILTISRLTDPTASSSQENTSIANLLNRAKGTLNTVEGGEFEKRSSQIHANVQNIRKHRNKAIAHSDLQHTLNAKTLPPLTYDEIENAIKDICKLMTDIARVLFGWTIYHNVTIPFGHGGDALLRVLAHAHEKTS